MLKHRLVFSRCRPRNFDAWTNCCRFRGRKCLNFWKERYSKRTFFENCRSFKGRENGKWKRNGAKHENIKRLALNSTNVRSIPYPKLLTIWVVHFRDGKMICSARKQRSIANATMTFLAESKKSPSKWIYISIRFSECQENISVGMFRLLLFPLCEVLQNKTPRFKAVFFFNA